MAPIRVIKGPREAFKGTVPKARMSIQSLANSLGAPKSQHETGLPKVNVQGQGVQADSTPTTRLTKKFQSRIRRASRFGDHGSSTAFKKVVRRRERINATALGLPSSPPVQYQFHPQSPSQRQAPAPDQPLVSPRPTDSRRTVRESRFAEKHMGVPISIYLACKSVDRGPIKSVERHGSETRHSRLVLLARAKGSPFRGSKRRAMFMQSSDGFVLGAAFNQDSEYDLQHSSPSPRAGFGVGEVQSFSPPSAIKDIPPAPSQESLDEMEDVVPAPLIYHHLVSHPVQTFPFVRTPTVPASPVQALHTPPPAQFSSRVPPALTVRSPVVQPPSTVPSAEHIPRAQPTQPSQLLPTMSHFCRNLGGVSKEMAYVLRALSGVRARERCALPPTTSVALKTQSSCASPALARLPLAPTKAKLPYIRPPNALYADSDG